MELGTIFKWNNFPDPRDPNVNLKPRWFIYIGKTSIYIEPVVLYICTTTTQLYYYEPNGNRFDNLFLKYKKCQYGFEKDSILDIDMNFYRDITEERMERYKKDIDIKGKLPENELRRIYKLICKSKIIQKKVKQDIYNSFNLANITDLDRPR